MHIDDMKVPQKRLAAESALHCMIGTLLSLFLLRFWMIGVLGAVLIAMSAARMREQPGFQRVQLFASLTAGWCVVCVAFIGMKFWRLNMVLWMVIPVLEVLLVYALWQAFGRMCADGNRIGRAALCAMLLCAALTLALYGMSLVYEIAPPIYWTVLRVEKGFNLLAVLLLAAFLIVKRRKLKEDTV